MNTKNSVLDYIRNKQPNWYRHVRQRMKKGYLKILWNGVHLKEKKKDLEIRGCWK